MADNQGKRQRGIEALLAERKKFETWLAQLEERRASSAEHVFLRVHADYTERLDEVGERLRAEVEGIRALVSGLEARLVSEQQAVTEKTDERAELELRASVGEFSEKEWNAIRSRLDGTIGEIRARFDATERDLVELKQTLASVSGAPRKPTPAHPSAAIDREPPLPEPGPSGKPETGHASRTTAPDDAGTESPGARPDSPAHRNPTPFDELAFLKSVAGTPTVNPVPPRATAPGEARVGAPPAEAARDADESGRQSAAAALGEPAGEQIGAQVGAQVGEQVGEPIGEAMGEPLLGEIAGGPAHGARGGAEAEAPSRGRRTSGTMTAAPMAPLGAPTPRTSQAVRTLKCQECETLNFPTEWYCERCGGELAAF